MAGWIKIHRDITNHWIFQDAEKFKWWIDMILLASHEDKKTLVGGKLVDFKRGQIIGSLSFFSKRWGRSKEKVLNFLKLLESDQMIDRCTDQKVTIITICKYEDYQKVEESSPTDVPTDNNTNVRPMSDQCPTETKNVKNVEEINITTTACAYTCTYEEFAQRYRAEGNWEELALMLHTNTDNCKSLFSEFVSIQKHDGKGWKDYSDFKRHFRIWASKQRFEKPKTTVTTKPKGKTARELGLL